MKLKIFLVLGLGTLLPFTARTQIYSENIVGYVNTTFNVGNTLFGNPLASQDDKLNNLIPNAPTGSMVSLWDSTTCQFSQTSVFSDGSWSLNFSLSPGQGAMLTTPTAFMNTFVGTVLFPEGSVLLGDVQTILPPPAFTGPSGTYLWSSITPLGYSPTGLDAFKYIVGRDPAEGEQVTTLDSVNQAYHTTTFTSGGWDNGGLTLQVGEAAFFKLTSQAVPESSTQYLLLLGLPLAMALVPKSRLTQKGNH